MWFRLFIINLPYKSIAQRNTYKKMHSHTQLARRTTKYKEQHRAFVLCAGKSAISIHPFLWFAATVDTVVTRLLTIWSVILLLLVLLVHGEGNITSQPRPDSSWFVVDVFPDVPELIVLPGKKDIYAELYPHFTIILSSCTHTDTHTKSLLVNWLVVESEENFFVKSEPPSVFSPHSPHTQISEWRWFRLMPFGCCSCICVHVQFHCMCCCKRSFSSVVAIVAFDELKCTCNH